MINWDTDNTALPLTATATANSTSSGDLLAWLSSNQQAVQSKIDRNGAILLHGFNVTTPYEFESIAGMFCKTFNDYTGGNSPRTRVASHVFTSTEYPKESRISMHNEASYLKRMPAFILFFCAEPAASGGQTPLADCRRVLARIEPQVRRRFEQYGVRYVTNLHGGRGLGRSWFQSFGTKDRLAIEKHLAAEEQTYQWTADGGLRTWMQAPATVRHPRTKEDVWINQAEQWHPSSLEDSVREALLSILPEENLPHNALLGDGSPLRSSDLDNIREAMAAEERIFEWHKGDVLICDNLLVMHGRQPYSGGRRVLAVMG